MFRFLNISGSCTDSLDLDEFRNIRRRRQIFFASFLARNGRKGLDDGEKGVYNAI